MVKFSSFFAYLSFVTFLFAGEGMWLFNELPLERIQERYHVDLTPAWIEHVQKSSLRISAGGSGSFISSQGLVLTNHHVGSAAIYNLSTESSDLMQGFLATTFEEEIPCPNLFVDQLISMENITDKVNWSLTEEMTLAEKEKERQMAMAKIKQRAVETTGLQPEIVVLYQGARYDLYLYRRYSDVRLVMAPEKQIAFFGGDRDNFEYPRYALDCCFFRIYEDGKPLQTDHYLKCGQLGPLPFEPLFVSGNPGTTNRILTSDHLKFLKDYDIAILYRWLNERIQDLTAFSQTSAEHARIAEDDLFGFQNAYKVISSFNEGLAHSSFIAEKEKQEKKWFHTINPAPWIDLQKALTLAKSFYLPYLVLEGRGSSYCKLYAWAKELVRVAVELQKPNDERFEEYADSELVALQLRLFSSEPVYKNLEQVLLERSLIRTVEILGDKHPVTAFLLDGMPANKRVSEMLEKTSLEEVEVRKELFNNPRAILDSQDPFIVLARQIDPYARALRKKKENGLDVIVSQSYSKIVPDLLHIYGSSLYPDATFTLRLSYGEMRGYFEGLKPLVPLTTVGGAFTQGALHGFEGDDALPSSWMHHEELLDKKTPFNFVLTTDIVGGNSGSPVINKSGEWVGLIFDGNQQSNFWSFQYNDSQGRAIAVHVRAILEALQTIYSADRLIGEIKQGKRS